MFGTPNPWNVNLTHLVQHQETLGDARLGVFLMKGEVKTEGDVFAFTARIYDTQPISFQIWRPIGPVEQSGFDAQLIAYRQIIPSVKQLHEEVRFTTLRALLLLACYI